MVRNKVQSNCSDASAQARHDGALTGHDGTLRAQPSSIGLISIIVPTLNEQEAIAGTLMPLQPLRGKSIEVIVTDGGSTDRTLELARPLADRVQVARRGRAVQMNVGAALARGEVLLFLHADTRLPLGFDELIRGALSRRGRAWGRFDTQIDSRNPILWIVACMMNTRASYSGIATGDQAIFARRADFERIGGFPAIPLMEDIALSKAMKRISWPAHIPTRVVTSARRWEQYGALNTILLMWRLRWAYFRGVDPAKLAAKYG